MKKFASIMLALAMVLSLCGCSQSNAETKQSSESSNNSSSATSGSSSSGSSGSSSYTAPKSGQSASDYIKEQDSDLYDTITDRYDSATKDSSDDYDYDKGFGYTAPKAGQSFSDYVKEQDPDLYNSLFD